MPEASTKAVGRSLADAIAAQHKVQEAAKAAARDLKSPPPPPAPAPPK